MNSIRDRRRAEQFIHLVHLRHDLSVGRLPTKMAPETMRDLLANWPRDPMVKAAVTHVLQVPPRTAVIDLLGSWANTPAIPLGYRLGNFFATDRILHLVVQSPLPCRKTPSWVLTHAIRVMLDKRRFCCREWLGLDELRMVGLQWWLCGADELWDRVDYSVVDSAMNRVATDPPSGLREARAALGAQ